MDETKERRQAERQLAEGTGSISFGQEAVQCRIIDLSASGAQIRIDGRRASRNLMGKRASLALDPASPRKSPVEGRVVWVRPAVNGVYLGLELDRSDVKPTAAHEQVETK
jgi:hypothetical protein